LTFPKRRSGPESYRWGCAGERTSEKVWKISPKGNLFRTCDRNPRKASLNLSYCRKKGARKYLKRSERFPKSPNNRNARGLLVVARKSSVQVGGVKEAKSTYVAACMGGRGKMKNCPKPESPAVTVFASVVNEKKKTILRATSRQSQSLRAPNSP